jgi:hypothetical protein
MDNLIVGLINLSDVQWTIGAFKSVDENLRRQIALSKDTNNETYEVVGHQDLGLRLAFRGKWREAEQELDEALRLSLQSKDARRQAIICAHRARKELLLARGTKSKRSIHKAIIAADRIMKLLDTNLRERHYVRACWLTGAAHLLNGNLVKAEYSLHEAVNQCRRINLVEFEPDILLELAKWHVAKGEREEAVNQVYEAFTIAEQCGYVLACADACILLAQMALQDNNCGLAQKYAEQAYTWAQCDGPPDYTYKVAFDEAAALLERT